MLPKTIKQQRYYFTDRLREQLDQIRNYPLTVIEAPGGFGKTTAVREYLRNEHPHAACEWYTCLGEPLEAAWMEICELFSPINSRVADELKGLKALSAEALGHAGDCLKGLNCQRETYLVIDNYQMVNFSMHRELISAFSTHEDPNLHLIFITHQLNLRRRISLGGKHVYKVDASSFFFDREGISSLFSMEGLCLGGNELESVFKGTQGWISAVRLQMVHYKETGSLTGSAGVERLIEHAVWNRLAPMEKDFLLSVSVFDGFTARQAAHMLDYEVLPGTLEEELKASDFIRFVPGKRLFVMQGILLEYLRNRLKYRQTEEYQNRVLYKAGRSYAALGQYAHAAEYFYQIRDFDAILALPFTREYLEAQKEDCEEGVFLNIFLECPQEAWCAHPFAMIVFAHHALLNGRHGVYEKLCGLLDTVLQGETALPQEQARRLQGEVILLKALGSFNDLSKIREGYEAAGKIWGESPNIPENSTPWFSVFPTTLGMLWRESGALDELLRTVDEMKPVYRAFSKGQGAGLAQLIRAEAMLERGADKEAEVLCDNALCEARESSQAGIRMYAELCLARIFILRGDAEKFLAVFERLQGYAAAHMDIAARRMADMCLSIISLLLGVKDYVAPWLYDIERIHKYLYAAVIPFAQTLYMRLLLLDKRYNELYALGELLLEALDNPGGSLRYRMPQMYCLIFLAAAKQSGSQEWEARQYLKRALDIALPDGIYLPFAGDACVAELLLEQHRLLPNAESLLGAAPEEEAPNPPTSLPGAIKGGSRPAASGGGTRTSLFCSRFTSARQTA